MCQPSFTCTSHDTRGRTSTATGLRGYHRLLGGRLSLCPLLSPSLLPFPLHLLCLLVNLMGFPLKTCSHILPSAVGRIKFWLCCTVFSHGPMRNIGFLGRWGMYACPQCLPSDTVPIRSWTRTLRPPGIRHRHLPYHTMPCDATVGLQLVSGCLTTGNWTKGGSPRILVDPGGSICLLNP